MTIAPPTAAYAIVNNASDISRFGALPELVVLREPRDHGDNMSEYCESSRPEAATGLGQTVFFHSTPQGGSADAQAVGSHVSVPIGCLERLFKSGGLIFGHILSG